MSVFENFSSAEVTEAAQRYIAKQDDRELADAIAQSRRVMTPQFSRAFVEAMFEAFHERGESSEDAAESAGVALAGVAAADPAAVRALFEYAARCPGLLKEALVTFIARNPRCLDVLPSALVDGIVQKLRIQ